MNIVTFNTQGINSLTKREAIERYMESHNIQIAAITETRHHITHKESRSTATWYFAGSDPKP